MLETSFSLKREAKKSIIFKEYFSHPFLLKCDTYREYLDDLGFQVDIGSDEGRRRVFAAFLSVCRFSLFPSLLPSNCPFLTSQFLNTFTSFSDSRLAWVSPMAVSLKYRDISGIQMDLIEECLSNSKVFTRFYCIPFFFA